MIDQGPNACRVEWRGTFEPDGVEEEQAQGMVRGIYTGGIAGVRKLLGGDRRVRRADLAS